MTNRKYFFLFLLIIFCVQTCKKEIIEIELSTYSNLKAGLSEATIKHCRGYVGTTLSEGEKLIYRGIHDNYTVCMEKSDIDYHLERTYPNSYKSLQAIFPYPLIKHTELGKYKGGKLFKESLCPEKESEDLKLCKDFLRETKDILL